MREWKRRYMINEDYFETWSSNMAYLLGFIAADGNVRKYILSIQVKKRDEYVLDFFIKEIGHVPKKKRKIKKRTYVGIRFCSKHLVDSLSKYRIVPRKSSIIRADFEIPKEYIGDYIRGVFDGDGWVCCRRNSIGCGIVSANREFLEDLSAKAGVKGKIRERIKEYRSPVYCWEMGKTETLQLRDVMYRNDGFSFFRKKDRFFSEFYKRSEKFWTEKQMELLVRNFDRPLREMPDIIGKSYKAISKKKWEIRTGVANAAA